MCRPTLADLLSDSQEMENFIVQNFLMKKHVINCNARGWEGVEIAITEIETNPLA